MADYPSHDELRRYFQAYVKRFQLLTHIRFQTEVLSCDQTSDQWRIRFSSVAKANATLDKLAGQKEQNKQNKQKEQEEIFSHLIVCNGHHFQANIPSIPGTFEGDFLHSHRFKKAEPFRDQRVLVIGGGNSGCDVAVETSRVSARTEISWRRGYRIIPKFFMGKPSDINGERLSFLPLGIRARLAELLIYLSQGSNKLYGLPEPDHKFGSTHPTVNDELLYRIRHGKIHPRPDIERMEGKMVYFKDGKQAEFDSIIACTGYKIAHPFFEKSLIDFSEGAVRLYQRFAHPKFKNLYFVGLIQPFGCVWPLAELQCKLIAKELSGKWKRPDGMADWPLEKLYTNHYQQIQTQRHTITVDYFNYRKELRTMLKKCQ